MAALTFREIKMFAEILRSDFDIQKFTPQFFYDATNFQTSYRYADIVMFLQHFQRLRTGDAYQSHLEAILGRECGYAFREIGEIINLSRSAVYAKNYLTTGNYETTGLTKFNEADDEEITVSKRFKDMRLASLKTSHLTMQEAYHKAVLIAYKRLEKNLRSILNKGINENYIASLYNEKIAGDFEKERAEATKKYNDFLKEKKQSIVSNALAYDNFFNFITAIEITSCQEKPDRKWSVFPGEPCVANFFVKKTDEHGKSVWKESFLNASNFRPQYNEKHPTSIIMYDIFFGNTNGIDDFSTPVFHNDKFSHFEDLPVVSPFTYGGSNDDLKYGEVAKYLNSKGFKVRIKTKFLNGEYKTTYNRADVILGSWISSTKDYKIENLKGSVSFLTAQLISMFSDLTTAKKASKNDLTDGAVSLTLATVYRAFPTRVKEYCSFLKTLYITETDLEVKAVIEASIFSVREMYKNEYTNYFKTISTKDVYNELRAGLGRKYSKMKDFQELHSTIMNDDLYPHGILKSTNKISEMKCNVARYTARNIALHHNFTYEQKIALLGERAAQMKQEYQTLSTSWSKANRAKADEIRTHMHAFHNEANEAMSAIYTAGTVDSNRVLTVEVRTDENSLPNTLAKLVHARGEGSEDGFAQNAEDFRRLQPGEGVQNDSAIEFNEQSREQHHAAHEQRTGKKIASDKIEFATSTLDSQAPINPKDGDTSDDDYRRSIVEEETKLDTERRTSIDAVNAADRRIIEEEEAAARRSSKIRRTINRVIDFFTK